MENELLAVVDQLQIGLIECQVQCAELRSLLLSVSEKYMEPKEAAEVWSQFRKAVYSKTLMRIEDSRDCLFDPDSARNTIFDYQELLRSIDPPNH